MTSQVFAIPPPRRGGFVFDRLPVVSPPANFLMALRAIENADRMLKKRVSQRSLSGLGMGVKRFLRALPSAQVRTLRWGLRRMASDRFPG